MVRLLATHRHRVLAVSRADGAGRDIPTLPVTGGTVREGLELLMSEYLGRLHPCALLGWVHNVVPDAPDDYAWPSPNAYFAVWRCVLPANCEPQGSWLDPAEAEVEMARRHWWPLLKHLRQARAGTSGNDGFR